MSEKTTPSNRGKSSRKYRVGRVTIYQRGKVWYLYYYENGRRIRRRWGNSLAEAKQLAAQVNAQLAVQAPAVLSFQPLSIAELRQQWLDYHEQVSRSSLATIRRYRAATDHLLRFVESHQSICRADILTLDTAEGFVRYLRKVKVSPNGHPNTDQRHLRDKGILFILESCRTLFNFAARHRHLPPYHENPFAQLELGRILIEDAKPIELFTFDQEQAFWAACDDWQFPIFLTMALTGMRPGEVVHLLVPDDVDFSKHLIRVQNKPDLGWRTKTRNHREIPLVPELAAVLQRVIAGRETGPLFLRRKFFDGHKTPVLSGWDRRQLAAEQIQRMEIQRCTVGERFTRTEEGRIAQGLWRDAGMIKPTILQVEFKRITNRIGWPHLTCPKMFRHMFATALQEANVDPLIRQELMGHAPAGRKSGGLGMTAVYTHTQDTTRRTQLMAALAKRAAAIEAARRWLSSFEEEEDMRLKTKSDGYSIGSFHTANAEVIDQRDSVDLFVGLSPRQWKLRVHPGAG